jgi:tRNA-dihydrouridine synthase B
MNLYPPDTVILAPLSGYSDLPYRRSFRRFGCKYAFTEMIDAGSLAYGNDKTSRLMERGEDEPWLGAQLVGSNPDCIKKAVAILNSRDYDVLDFNLGCPVPKVAKKGAGAALGQNVDKALQLFEIIKSLSKHPVSAKIRILDDNDPQPTLKLVKGLVDAGAEAITIHGRIKKAFYSGPVFFDIIKAAREAVDIQVIANGGIMGLATYDEIREKTGCDCVMLARGAMGNPWLFKEIELREKYVPPNAEELANELETHILEMIDYYGETLALRVGRKTMLDYMRGRGFNGEIKSKVSFLSKKDDFLEFMKLIRMGPSDRYWQWLKSSPDSDRQMSR